MAGRRSGFEAVDGELAAMAKRSTDVSGKGHVIHREIVHAYRRIRRQIPNDTGQLERALTRVGGPNQVFLTDKNGFDFIVTLRAARYANVPKINLFKTKISKTIGEWVRHGE